MARKKAAQAATVGGYEVELWPIEQLIPYEQNPRAMPEQAVVAVANSIQAFGFRQPIIVDEHGVIIAGHTRRAAALRLSHSHVPVHVARNLTIEQARAFRIADNRVAQETSWDDDLLAIEIMDLEAAGFDTALTGFNLDELQAIMDGMDSAEGGAGRDEATEEQPGGELLARLGELTVADPTVVPDTGTVWALGPHVLCVMCPMTDWRTWGKLLKGDDDLLCVYPGIFVPLAARAETKRLVMVQSDNYIAGHILDRWNQAHEGDQATLVEAP